MIKIPIDNESDVVEARLAAGELALQIGLNELACAEVRLAVSEICNNTIKHAKGGICEIYTKNKDKVLEIKIVDKGPGIANISIAMERGFSSIKNSLGIGFDVAERSMDHFDIDSVPKKGTKIIMKKYLPIPDDLIQYGVISLADEEYQFNGDGFVIKEFDGDKVLLAIIDGLGQGYKASVLTASVKNVIEEHYQASLTDIIELCDILLKTTDLNGGVAMSLMLLKPEKLLFCGVGDTHCYYKNSKGVQHLLQSDGIVGSQQLPKLVLVEQILEPQSNLVLCTDGIYSQINFDELDWQINAQQIAYNIFNKHQKAYGDVSVLIIKYG